MRRDGEAVIFWLTAGSAAASLISIAAMESLMGAAVAGWILLWLLKRPVPIRWPSYFVPLVAFIATTLLSLAFSPDPATGEHQIGKFVLFPMGLLAGNRALLDWFVHPEPARNRDDQDPSEE